MTIDYIFTRNPTVNYNNNIYTCIYLNFNLKDEVVIDSPPVKEIIQTEKINYEKPFTDEYARTKLPVNFLTEVFIILVFKIEFKFVDVLWIRLFITKNSFVLSLYCVIVCCSFCWMLNRKCGVVTWCKLLLVFDIIVNDVL